MLVDSSELVVLRVVVLISVEVDVVGSSGLVVGVLEAMEVEKELR